MEDKLDQVRFHFKIVSVLFSVVIVLLVTVITIQILPARTFESPDISTPVSWKPKSLANDLPADERGEMIKYGFNLITKTSDLIGPQARNISMRYAGNNLACSNCHLDAGRKIGSGSFVGVANRFPQFRGRENKIGTLEERINGCMERSMNGQVLPNESREMQAIVAYMEWLSESVPADVEKLYKGYVTIEIPEEKADPIKGEKLYKVNCQICHMEKGKGLKSADNELAYIYPPLAGTDTYNDGAGMNRIITAAQFIKANMPFGATYDAPRVTDEEAYHIAAYINSLDRPEKPNKELDFPERKLKPVSTPYGPWADDFSSEQHKYGPFQPIMEYYKKKYDIAKTK